MRRIVTLFSTTGAVIALALWLAEFADVHSDTLFHGLCRDADRADCERRQRDAFYPFLCETLDAVADGRLSLRAASRRLLADAQRLHPTFLRHLEVSEKGADIAAKIVNYVYSYFEGDSAMRAHQIDARRRAELTSEYRRIMPKAT